MPAKTKYLSTPGQRVSKILAAILGGYAAAMLLHVALAKMAIDDTPVVMTTSYSAFILWVGFMILAFFIKKAWQTWGLYATIIIVCAAIIFL